MNLRGVRILLIESDHDNREAMTCVLELYGAQITAVDCDAAAVAAAKHVEFDVVISDIPRGQSAVASLVQTIRALDEQRHSKTPAIGLSAWVMSGERERILNAGFDAYLPKPADIKALVDAVRAVVHISEAGAVKPDDWDEV